MNTLCRSAYACDEDSLRQCRGGTKTTITEDAIPCRRPLWRQLGRVADA